MESGKMIFFVITLFLHQAQGQTGTGAYLSSCNEDSDCGTWNNVCSSGFCMCPSSQMPITPTTIDGNPDTSRYFCAKACNDGGECDASNHETCRNGICECDSNYYRINSLKCISPMDYTSSMCEQNFSSTGYCSLDQNVPCTQYPGNPAPTCTESGVCCTKMWW